MKTGPVKTGPVKTGPVKTALNAELLAQNSGRAPLLCQRIGPAVALLLAETYGQIVGINSRTVSRVNVRLRSHQ